MPAPLLFLLICLMAGCTKTETKPGDPANEFEKYWQKASLPTMPRSAGAVGLLADGRVLLACGTPPAGTAWATTEIYDPATDKWTVASTVSPQYGEEFVRLKSGKMVLLSRSSSIVQVFDPAKKGWMSPGTMSGQQGDRNTVSGACELQNGKVVLVGMSSIAVWDQNTSFVSYKQSNGSGALDFSTVHQLPGTSQFIVFGNTYYQGQGVIYELDPNAGNAPKAISVALPLSGLMMKSVEVSASQVFLAGGSIGTDVRNNPVPPHLFNTADKTFTRLMNSISGRVVVGKDPAGNVWFTDNYLSRYRFEAATQKVVPVTIPGSTQPVPSPFPDGNFAMLGGNGTVFLSDGRLMAFTMDQAWITK